jgi:cation transport ATPase
MEDDVLVKNAPAIDSILLEEDSPKVETSISKVRIDEIKTKRDEDRKDADSQHARTRDTWITIAGLILVLILIAGYFYAVQFLPKNDYIASLLNLLNSVVMLIIGYIFGTKITHR